MAGVETVFAVEKDVYAAQTYLRNFPKTPVHVGDIAELTDEKIAQIPKRGSESIVFGGPPCQGFSYSNSRTRNVNNENNWLFRHFIRVVRVWHPDYIVFENVRGIVDTAGGMFVSIVVEELSAMGYHVENGLLNAMDFEVPQNRTRFFLIGSRHGSVGLPSPCKKKRVNVAQVFCDLPSLRNGATIDWLPYKIPKSKASAYAKRLRSDIEGCSNHIVSKNTDFVLERYKHVPQGGNWLDIPEQLMANYADRTRCHTGIYHRLKMCEPSVVIGNYRKNMLIHPTEDRGLSVREAARIQSFPDWFTFMGSIGFQQQQVGNAVPVSLSKMIFDQIMMHG